MIRVTQSFTIRKIIDRLDQEGYNVIYKDLPHGSRGGIGKHGKINVLFEKLFDRSPDILAIKDGKLLVLIEVNHSYKKELNDKFREYNNKRGELLIKISEIIQEDIKELEFGFGIVKKKFPKIDFLFDRFHKFYFDENNEIIHEVHSNDDSED